MNFKELSSFKLSDAIKFHDELNPTLFKDESLKLDIRKKLLKIADDFIEYLGINDLDVEDIIITGSNAAYTYTPHSDIDLHVIVNLKKIENDDIYKELFDSKKIVYNDLNNIKIYGYDVELYVENKTQEAKSLGKYSVLKNKWINYPIKRKVDIDEDSASKKYKKLLELINLALRSKNLSRINKLIHKIKKYRQTGLDKNGEFSIENIVYKALRTNGLINNLYDLKNKLHSEELSIAESDLAIKFLKPNELRGSYTDQQLFDMGFRKTNKGQWYIKSYLWHKLVNSGKLKESEILNKKTLNPESIAKKFKVDVQDIMKQLLIGVKIELEHTDDENVAYEIALDHLGENPNYYTKLSNIGLEEDENIDNNESLPSVMVAKKYIHKILKVAQHEYDNWDESDIDTYAGGGICHLIANEICGVLYDLGIECTTQSCSYEQHVYVVAKFEEGIYQIDIPYHVYETGGGFSWKKLPNIQFESNHVIFYKIASDTSEWNNYVDLYESASGYIPTEKEKNDPRFKTALTTDVRPGEVNRNVEKMHLGKLNKKGLPKTLR